MQKITAESPESKSPDLVAENIAKLKELFPELLTEGENGSSVNLDVLKSLVGDQTVTDTEEKYGLNWHGKRKARQLALTPSTGTLRPCPEDSVDWDSTQNLMIEGDNLEVLKLLQKSYTGKVKLIYIDPPYNTGKDFVYPDNFKDNIKNYLELTGQTGEGGNKLSSNPETSGRFHTDWLNMMYPRLKLARNLLREDGVIFISIDDNEVSNSRKLCDEIFGDENFVGLLSVENNPKGRKNSKFVSVSSDYCLMFAKNVNESSFTENIPKRIDDLIEDENGDFVHNSGKRVLVGENNFNEVVTKFNSDKNYSVYYNGDSVILKQENSVNDVDSQLAFDGYKRYFSSRENLLVENTYSKQKFLDLFEKRAIEFKENKLFEKNFNTSIRIKSIVTNREYEAIINGIKKTYVLDVKTTSAGSFFKELFNTEEIIFNAPKNVSFLKLLVTLFDDTEFITIDFFSGSATTAHAIYDLNSQDGGKRKFILVQLPELCPKVSEACKAGYKTIADIGKERLRRVGQRIRAENPLLHGDLGFRVFKLDSTNILEWDPNRVNLAESLEASVDHLKSNRTEQDILFELLLKLGLDLCVPMEQRTIAGKTVHSIGAGVLITCLDKSIARADAEPLAQGILAWLKELNTAGDSTLVFRDSAFADDVAKTNLSKILEQNGIAAKNIRSL